MVDKELVSWVETQVRTQPPGTRLPADRALARQFGLSKATVGKALRRLCDQGRLVRQVGRGTYTPSAGTPEPVPATPSSSESLEAVLSELVTGGSVRVGAPLPSAKELCFQFGVSRRSVRHAYERLVSRRLAVRVGRGYYAGPDFESVLGAARGADVHFFMKDEPDFGHIHRHDYLATAYQAMERVLYSYRARLHYRSLQELASVRSRWQTSGRIPLGLVFVRTEGSDMKPVLPLLQRGRRGHAPTPRVLTDVRTGDFAEIGRVGEIVSRGHINTLAARAVARYAVERRFASVSFFFEANRWMWDYPQPDWPIVKSLAEMSAHARPPRCRFAVLDPRGSMHFESLFRVPRATPAILQRLRKHKAMSIEDLRGAVVFGSDEEGLLRRERGVGLWVFGSAARASAGLEYARSVGLRVPEEVSVISLEDDPRYFHHGISYCGPDFDRLGYLMAHTLLGDIPAPHSRLGLLDAPGRIIHRETTIE